MELVPSFALYLGSGFKVGLCGGLNMLGLGSGTVRRCGLGGGGVSLDAGFEVSTAHTIPS